MQIPIDSDRLAALEKLLERTPYKLDSNDNAWCVYCGEPSNRPHEPICPWILAGGRSDAAHNSAESYGKRGESQVSPQAAARQRWILRMEAALMRLTNADDPNVRVIAERALER